MHALGHVAADQAPAGYGGRPSCRNAFHRRLGELDHHHAGADDSSSAQLYYWLLSGLGRSWESNRALVILTPVFSATCRPRAREPARPANRQFEHALNVNSLKP